MRSKETCICEWVYPLPTNSRFLLLIHVAEYRKQIGTARLTSLNFENSKIFVGTGDQFKKNQELHQELLNDDFETVLLYPNQTAKALEDLPMISSCSSSPSLATKPFQFIILDGTWANARKILDRFPLLQTFQSYSFSSKIYSRYLIRKQPRSFCLSTIETTLEVLRILSSKGYEPKDLPNHLSKALISFDKMIELQVKHTYLHSDRNPKLREKYKIIAEQLNLDLTNLNQNQI